MPALVLSNMWTVRLNALLLHLHEVSGLYVYLHTICSSFSLELSLCTEIMFTSLSSSQNSLYFMVFSKSKICLPVTVPGLHVDTNFTIPLMAKVR